MSTLVFNDFYFFLPTSLGFIFIWFIFFLNNYVSIFTTTQDNGIGLNTLKSKPLETFKNIFKNILYITNLSFFFLWGQNSCIFFNNVLINNTNLKFIFIFLILGLILAPLFNKTISVNQNATQDYIFIITNLTLLLPYIFCINTFFVFIFFLEFLSCFLFYKLISSSIWYKNYSSIKINFKIFLPLNFLNMIFFQYWVTFFSTIFLIYSYISIINIFGTSEWLIFNLLLLGDSYSLLHKSINILLSFFLILSFFLKLGMAPFQMIKVEIYNGLSIFTIFFYTVYYFTIFFIFFLYFIVNMCFCYTYYYYFIIYLLILFGVLYIISLMFDLTQLKSFLLYSTLLNSIGFIILFLSNL